MNKSTREFLIRGGLGSSALAALLFSGLACSDGATRDNAEHIGAEQASASRAEEAPVELLPSLETELTSVHQPSLPDVPPAPAVEADPEPEPNPYAPSIDEDAPVGVRRIVIAGGVENREPVGAADEFALGQSNRTYVFVEALNHTDEEGPLHVTFEPEGGEITGHVTLHIPANATRWRTWAYTRHIYTPGRWRAVIRDDLGSVVAERAFEVVE